MRLYTIGFTKKSAEDFFETLLKAKVRRVIDIRLNNVSQLAGFTKKNDLAYFLKKICNIEYLHLPILAPTQDILDAYRKRRESWQIYEERFIRLMKEREIENNISRHILEQSCLLCSEDKPQKCHRRLVSEYLKQKWGNVDIQHL